MSFFEKFYQIFIEKGYYTLMLEGFKNTIVITLGALVIGLVIGTIIAVIKYFGEDSKKMRPLVWLCDLYTTVVRGIPVVVLLLIFFFVIFAKSSNGIAIATLTFGINSGAYMAELIRSGLNAVNAGQIPPSATS